MTTAHPITLQDMNSLWPVSPTRSLIIESNHRQIVNNPKQSRGTGIKPASPVKIQAQWNVHTFQIPEWEASSPLLLHTEPKCERLYPWNTTPAASTTPFQHAKLLGAGHGKLLSEVRGREWRQWGDLLLFCQRAAPWPTFFFKFRAGAASERLLEEKPAWFAGSD